MKKNLQVRAKFSRKRGRHNLLDSKNIKILNGFVVEQADAEARIKEINLIYKSLVGIAEGQKNIEIIVPNGKWIFTNSDTN